MAEENQPILPKTSYRPPCLIRIFIDFMYEIVYVGPEYGIKVTTVVENFRALFYFGMVITVLVGYIVTTNFVTEDHAAVVADVFGGTNLCSYLDYPPSTYIAPIVYIFPMFAMIAYNIVSIFRINISCGELKISYLAKNLLVASHAYTIISVIWFLAIFEVHPDREVPITMVIHTIPYFNLNIALLVLQLSVVWFGTNVAWKDIGFSRVGKKLFITLSWFHLIVLTVTTSIMCMFILNGIGDMGQGGLVGKGLWWDVHDPPKQILLLGSLFRNTSPLGDFAMAILVPFLQSVILKSKSFGNISKTHTVIFYITDNKSVDE